MGLSAAAIRAGQAFIEVLCDDSKARQVLKKFQAHTQSWATTMNNIGRAMLLPAVGLAIPLANTVRVFADFDKQLGRLKARLSDAETGMVRLRKQAIQLSVSAGNAFSPKEIVAGMVELAQAGNDTANIMKKMPAILNFAAAGEISVAEAASFASSAMNVFNLTAEQLGHATDIIVRAATDVDASVTDMAEAFKFVAPTAAQAGIPIHELVAALEILAQGGLKGEMAGTALRGVFLAMIDPSEKGAQALRQMGIQAINPLTGQFIGLRKAAGQMSQAFRGVGGGRQLQMLAQVFDNRMVTAMELLAKAGPEKFGGIETKLFETHGDSAKMAATQIENLEDQWGKFINTIHVFQMAITESVAEPLAKFLDASRNIVVILSEWAKRNPGMVRTMVALGTAVVVAAPALIALSVALKLVAFAFQPIFLGMTLLRTVLLGIGPAALFLGAVLKRVFQFTLVAAGKAILTFLASIATGQAILFKAMTSGILFLIANPLALLGIALVGIGAYFLYMSGVFGRMIATMKNGWQSLTADTKTWWEIVKGAVASGDMETAFEATTLFLKIQWAEAMRFLRAEWRRTVNFFQNVWDQAGTNIATGKAFQGIFQFGGPPGAAGLGPVPQRIQGGNNVPGGPGNGPVGQFSVPPEAVPGEPLSMLAQFKERAFQRKSAEIARQQQVDEKAQHDARQKAFDDQMSGIRANTQAAKDEAAAAEKRIARADETLRPRGQARLVAGGDGAALGGEVVTGPSFQEGVLAGRIGANRAKRKQKSEQMIGDLNIEEKQAERRAAAEEKLASKQAGIDEKRQSRDARAAAKQGEIEGHLAQRDAGRTSRALAAFEAADQRAAGGEGGDPNRRSFSLTPAAEEKARQIADARRSRDEAKKELAIAKRKKMGVDDAQTKFDLAQETFDTLRKTPAGKLAAVNEAQAAVEAENAPLVAQKISLPAPANETASQQLEREAEERRLQREEDARVEDENAKRAIEKDRKRLEVLRGATAGGGGANVPGGQFNPRLGFDLAGVAGGSAGTFSGAAVSGLGSSGLASRTAVATEETAKNTKKLLDKNGPEFGGD